MEEKQEKNPSAEEQTALAKKAQTHAQGYGTTAANTAQISQAEVLVQSKKLAGRKKPSLNYLRSLVSKEASSDDSHEASKETSSNETFIEMRGVRSGYGAQTVLHSINLCLNQGMSLCLIGPNGSGKSTVLNTLFALTNLYEGEIKVQGKSIKHLKSKDMLSKAGISYLLQDNSIFPDMTVEENLFMGGFLMNDKNQAHKAAEKILEKYDRLKARRNKRAGILSGGERRLLEISRSLIMNPKILLIDEPSIGLEPRFIDMVFEIMLDLKENEGKTIIIVEQNAKKGLAFADIGYVLVNGEVVYAHQADKLLHDSDVGRLFLGG